MKLMTFDFWQDHSEPYLEMAFKYDRCERIVTPDGFGKRTGECGDTVEIFLLVRNNHIHTISYQTDGCINTNACCNHGGNTGTRTAALKRPGKSPRTTSSHTCRPCHPQTTTAPNWP